MPVVGWRHATSWAEIRVKSVGNRRTGIHVVIVRGGVTLVRLQDGSSYRVAMQQTMRSSIFFYCCLSDVCVCVWSYHHGAGSDVNVKTRLNQYGNRH